MINKILELLDQLPPVDFSKSSYVYGDRHVPRVTRIISRCIHNDGLMYWANNLGFKHLSYNKVLKEAASIGTIAHNNIDAFLIDEEHKPYISVSEAENAYNSFLRWYSDIHKYANNIKVLMHEQSLICKYFGGTLDGLYKINNDIYIIDYKTSNHITFNYCLQLAAYIFMLERERNIRVNGCIILQLSKEEISYKEHVLNFNNPLDKQYMDDCKITFLLMVLYYYHLYNIENNYSNLNWG